MRWLASLKLPQPAQQFVFPEYLNAITDIAWAAQLCLRAKFKRLLAQAG